MSVLAVGSTILLILNWREVRQCNEVACNTFKEVLLEDLQSRIDPYKHLHNITSNPQTRILISIALKKQPLISDTINSIWKYLLENKKIVGQTKSGSVDGPYSKAKVEYVMRGYIDENFIYDFFLRLRS